MGMGKTEKEFIEALFWILRQKRQSGCFLPGSLVCLTGVRLFWL
jgi:hypothetical protein